MKSGFGTFYHSLTSRLMVLTIIFILGAEFFIFVPSLTQFKINYLNQKLIAAETAALSLEEVPRNMLSPELQEELLDSIGVNGVVIGRIDSRQLIFRENMPQSLDQRYNIKNRSFVSHATDSIGILLRGGLGNIQVNASANSSRFRSIGIVLNEKPIFDSMVEFSKGFIGLGALIAIITGTLTFITLNFLVIKPIGKMRGSIEAFRKKPENFNKLTQDNPRRDEIGTMEEDLALMQDDVSKALKEKTRLAQLGAAVSKINHDLRNILSGVQISSDRLSKIDDPLVQTLYPRIVEALDRGIELCQKTLKHGKANENPPRPLNTQIYDLVEEIKDTLDIKNSGLNFINSIPKKFELFCDPDHFYRLMMNLIRNAMEATPKGGLIKVFAQEKDGKTLIGIEDSGPGIPNIAKENLFEPFLGSTKGEGSGLGLPIVKELIEAHGGSITLEKSSEKGTLFCLSFPNPEN